MKFKTGHWYIAYRKKSLGTLLHDQDTPFSVIRNNPFQCSMDSFVFEYQGETYVFAELMHSWDRHGKIGYAKWNSRKQVFSAWKTVISEPYHLSYPYVFQLNDQIYMIPEANESSQIYAYRATEFPDKWVKDRLLLDGVKCVDTSFFDSGASQYVFTYDISDQAQKELLLYRIEDGIIDRDSRKTITTDDSCARPGGYVFRQGDHWIRVAQDCSKTYGGALYFCKFNCTSGENYQEEKLLHFTPEKLALNEPLNVLGIHTYSATDSFEVIDIKSSHFSPVSLLMRVIWKLQRICLGR